MDAKIQKWGNSLALRIPKAFADQMGLYSNSPVRISLEGDRLVVEPARHSLNEILADITPDNIHAETDWGDAEGREIW
jgi:antitoxin MazE